MIIECLRMYKQRRIKRRKERDPMEYYAHQMDDKKQYLKDHLEQTAALAEAFSVDYMKAIAWAAGKYHDLGKYGLTFQKEILENDRSVKYEHSSPGAIELGKAVFTEE